jgi:transcription initiation factor IIE alpha subunit
MSNNFIQWKGTDVCIDIYCPSCKHHSHYDGWFLYYFKCPKCGTMYEMGTEVSMTEMEEEPESCLQTVPLEE